MESISDLEKGAATILKVNAGCFSDDGRYNCLPITDPLESSMKVPVKAREYFG